MALKIDAGAVSAIVGGILRNLPEDKIKHVMDGVLDRVENICDAAPSTPNKIDDVACAVIKPLCTALRAQLGITEEPGSAYADPA